MTKNMKKIGESVDIASRVSGANAALKDLGVAGAAPETADLNRTRLGTKAVKPPKLQTYPGHGYTTSGTLVNPKVASQDDAPNYGPASGGNTACAKCMRYDKQDDLMGLCNRYDFYARKDYTCDGWTTKTGVSPSQFIRRKLR